MKLLYEADANMTRYLSKPGGPVGDGITDDTERIQAKHDAQAAARSVKELCEVLRSAAMGNVFGLRKHGDVICDLLCEIPVLRAENERLRNALDECIEGPSLVYREIGDR